MNNLWASFAHFDALVAVGRSVGRPVANCCSLVSPSDLLLPDDDREERRRRPRWRWSRVDCIGRGSAVS